MKFLEEIEPGLAFKFNNEYFLATTDFKEKNKNQFRYSISMNNGAGRWIGSNELIDLAPLFTVDSQGTIIPIKETKKTDENNI
jgi:hypothetical protein